MPHQTWSSAYRRQGPGQRSWVPHARSQVFAKQARVALTPRKPAAQDTAGERRNLVWQESCRFRRAGGLHLWRWQPNPSSSISSASWMRPVSSSRSARNTGKWSIKAAKHYAGSGVVVAIEPFPRCDGDSLSQCAGKRLQQRAGCATCLSAITPARHALDEQFSTPNVQPHKERPKAPRRSRRSPSRSMICFVGRARPPRLSEDRRRRLRSTGPRWWPKDDREVPTGSSRSRRHDPTHQLI